MQQIHLPRDLKECSCGAETSTVARTLVMDRNRYQEGEMDPCDQGMDESGRHTCVRTADGH